MVVTGGRVHRNAHIAGGARAKDKGRMVPGTAGEDDGGDTRGSITALPRPHQSAQDRSHRSVCVQGLAGQHD